MTGADRITYNGKPCLCCTPAIWTREASAAATAMGLEPSRLLAGCLTRRYTICRWEAFRALERRGFSYSSIGRSSGFHHSTVLNACKTFGPRLYTPAIPPKRDFLLVATGARLPTSGILQKSENGL